MSNNSHDEYIETLAETMSSDDSAVLGEILQMTHCIDYQKIVDEKTKEEIIYKGIKCVVQPCGYEGVVEIVIEGLTEKPITLYEAFISNVCEDHDDTHKTETEWNNGFADGSAFAFRQSLKMLIGKELRPNRVNAIANRFNHYRNMVWYARSTTPKYYIPVEKKLNPVEVENLSGDKGDWWHGYNSGCLAAYSYTLSMIDDMERDAAGDICDECGLYDECEKRRFGNICKNTFADDNWPDLDT